MYFSRAKQGEKNDNEHANAAKALLDAAIELDGACVGWTDVRDGVWVLSD